MGSPFFCVRNQNGLIPQLQQADVLDVLCVGEHVDRLDGANLIGSVEELEEPLYGYDLLPRPTLFPQRSREFLRALVATRLGISIRDVRLGPLNAAFSIAFPQCTAINTEKKKKQHTSKRGRKKKPP